MQGTGWAEVAHSTAESLCVQDKQGMSEETSKRAVSKGT